MPAADAQGDAGEIWVLDDGRPGHRNQSLALAEALQRHRAGLRLRELAAAPAAAAFMALLLRAPAPAAPPRLLIGAGHGTHAGLLAWRHRIGCPAVVLMRPGLPSRLFDLVIEPRHDGGRESARRWLSDGPLTRLRPGRERGEPGLILVGGPSPHFHWDEAALLRQLAQVCDGSGEWLLSTSRRTPVGFLERLRALRIPGLSAAAAPALGDGWLAAQLPCTAHCWVTPDSASMVYEALSAGCALGVLELRPRRRSRVAAGLRHLQARGLCTGFAAWEQGAPLQAPPRPLAEADRLAARILERGLL